MPDLLASIHPNRKIVFEWINSRVRVLHGICLENKRYQIAFPESDAIALAQ
jgi:hypothetical protein